MQSKMHKTLVRSSLIAAMSALTVPGVAGASVSLYSNQATFEGDAAAGGLSQLYVETFEEADFSGPYVVLNSPLESGVPNNGFPTGLDAPGLSVSGEGLLAMNPYYLWPHIPSIAVGTFQDFSMTTMDYGDVGAMAVGFDIYGIDNFITNIPEEVNYTIYDTLGGILDSGTFATPDAGNASGSFMGVISSEAIGSIEIAGFRFGLDTQEYVDDIQAWIIPAPSSVMLLGWGAAMARRRR